MQKTSTAVLLVFTFLVVSAFKDAAFSPFENGKYGYRIEIPEGFVMEGDWGKQTSWMYQPGEGEEFEEAVRPIISVVASDIPSRFSANALYNTKVKKIQEMIAEKDSPYDDLELLTLTGGYALMYKEVDRDDSQALNHWYVNVYGNNRYYIIEISGTHSQLRKWSSEFKHVVESFALVP